MNRNPRIVVGIGNPGPEYARTRHNAGFMTLDRVAERLGRSFRQGNARALELETRYKDRRVLLLKPLTFVNLSGETVRLIGKRTGMVPEEDLLVVSDDADLETGVIRFARKGSSGRHKGLEDIIRVVGPNFQRLRIGIGRDPALPLRDYVLSPFSKAEEKEMEEVFDLAAQGVLDWVAFGIQYCQNRYNRRQSERSREQDG